MTQAQEERNVVTLPGLQTSMAAVVMNKEVHEFYGGLFSLGVKEGQNLPHASHYQTAYPERSLVHLNRIVANLAAKTAPIQVTMQGFNVFHDVYVFWDAEPSTELTKLHRSLLKELDPIRQGCRTAGHQALYNDPSLDAALKYAIEEYGSPLAGPTERFHMTINCCSSPEEAEAAVAYLNTRGPYPDRYQWTLDKIAIGNVLPHGCCNRCFYTYNLEG